MKKTHKIILAALLLAGVVYGAVHWIVAERLEDLENKIRLDIAEQQTLLTSIAETTATNGADAVTESIVKDCTQQERVEFDALLGGLSNGLPQAELVKLERLFGRCANFYAQRKSVMVARLVREIEVYEKNIAQLAAISKDNHEEEYKVAEWKRLVDEEKKMSALFNTQVEQQDKIIQALLTGKSAQGKEIKAILHEAGETQGMLILTTRMTSEIRTSLKSI